MQSTARTLLLIAATLGLFAVLLGAFGAHALRHRIEPGLYQAYLTGAHYQAVHAIALLVVGLLSQLYQSRWLERAGWLLILGTLLFSGSLYLMAISGQRLLGMITPLGGTLLALGWLWLIIGLYKLPPSHRE